MGFFITKCLGKYTHYFYIHNMYCEKNELSKEKPPIVADIGTWNVQRICLSRPMACLTEVTPLMRIERRSFLFSRRLMW